MRFKRIKEDEPGLDIAPLIDIVFLLLIFFMLTSHFQLASGVHIKLPKMGQKLYEKEDNKIVLVIDKRGNIYLKGEKVELKDLGIKLHKLVEKDGLDQLLLEADQEVKHGRVVKVMDIAKRAGMSSIAIAAGWEPEKVF
ncbi:MAG: biopolymer transporter ExbD [Deltaproteobacteria bacterium]|nr:biopolymer transporter ExbD [Deltaproteobacteria bacterium]